MSLPCFRDLVVIIFYPFFFSGDLFWFLATLSGQFVAMFPVALAVLLFVVFTTGFTRLGRGVCALSLKMVDGILLTTGGAYAIDFIFEGNLLFGLGFVSAPFVGFALFSQTVLTFLLGIVLV